MVGSFSIHNDRMPIMYNRNTLLHLLDVSIRNEYRRNIYVASVSVLYLWKRPCDTTIIVGSILWSFRRVSVLCPSQNVFLFELEIFKNIDFKKSCHRSWHAGWYSISERSITATLVRHLLLSTSRQDIHLEMRDAETADWDGGTIFLFFSDRKSVV